MRAKEFITERNYGGPLYHLTSPKYAISILQDGLKFGSHLFRPNEAAIQKNKEYIYFLSASRDLTNYFRDIIRDTSLAWVSFTLNSEYINTNEFITGPVNFFGTHKYIPGGSQLNKKHSESEERIWSKKQIHPTKDIISEIHIYIPINTVKTDDDGMKYVYDGGYRVNINYLVEQAKQSGIPYYLYNDSKAFMLHRKDKAI